MSTVDTLTRLTVDSGTLLVIVGSTIYIIFFDRMTVGINV